MKFIQLIPTNTKGKLCDTSNFKKAIDKSFAKVYNDIVNSKGAADMISVALFWFIALIPYTKGCMKSQDFCTPLIFML